MLCPGILSYEADPNVVDEVSGMSPLMYAVASGCIPVSVALLRSGAGTLASHRAEVLIFFLQM